MTIENYINLLEKKHEAYFNVYRNYRLGGKIIDLYAEFHMRNQRYFLMGVLDAYEIHEYRIIKSFEEPELKGVREFAEWLQDQVKILVKPDSEHMSTNITGVIVVENGLDEDMADFIKKYSHTRYFGFGVKGWCDIRLLGVEIASNRVVANRKGREVMKDFEVPRPNLLDNKNELGGFK